MPQRKKGAEMKTKKDRSRKLLCLGLAVMISGIFSFFALAEEIKPGEGTVSLIDMETEEAETSSSTDTTADPAADETDDITGNEPFAPEELLGDDLIDNLETTIIGKDDRVKVKNPKKYPYSAICRFDGKYNCGCTWEGSGFMISRNTLLTAAHCLVCQKHNQWAYALTFYFGFKNYSDYLYCYNSSWNAYVYTFFPNGYTDQNDWGYVKFNSNVGDTTGWFGLRPLSDEKITSGKYTFAGYRNGKLKKNKGKLRVKDSTRMWMDMDTKRGNSGGPVFDSDNYAVGLFTTYYDDANSGIRVTKQMISELEKAGAF